MAIDEASFKIRVASRQFFIDKSIRITIPMIIAKRPRETFCRILEENTINLPDGLGQMILSFIQ